VTVPFTQEKVSTGLSDIAKERPSFTVLMGVPVK
jgi:hypothetical protein